MYKCFAIIWFILDNQIDENLCGLPNDLIVSPGSHTGVEISFTGDNADLRARFSVSVSFYTGTLNATLSIDIS